MLYKKVLERILKNKEKKSTGEYLNIPYPYPRLNEALCGIDKGQAIAVLAATGSGKSKWTRYTFIYNSYRFYKKTGYNVRILYFCMEDSKEQTYDFVICNYLKEEHGIIITHKELNSKTKELPNFVADKLKEAIEHFSDFEKIVTFIDGETEPDKMYNICEQVALNTGKVKSWIENIEGKEVKQSKYESDTHIIAIFDNMSNIESDDNSNEQVAILKFVKDYMRLRLCNFFQWTCVMVMQLDFESERQSFTKGGESIIAKLEPSLSGIGDSKRSSRSFHLIFSLFSPHRYDLLKYPIPPKDNPNFYYDIDILGNRFRSLRVIKSNGTDVGMRVGLLFDGISEIFEELPRPDSNEIKEVYRKIKGYTSKVVSTSSNIIFKEEYEEDPFPVA